MVPNQPASQVGAGFLAIKFHRDAFNPNGRYGDAGDRVAYCRGAAELADTNGCWRQHHFPNQSNARHPTAGWFIRCADDQIIGPRLKIDSRNGQGGIALIIVMVTIFVLTILAGGFALSMKVETKLARNASYESELEWIGRSGVELACYILAEQLNISSEPYDSLNQTWAGGPGSMATSNSPLAQISLKDHKLGNGTYSIKITDLERKFNINTDALSGAPLLEQAFIRMGVDVGEYPAIMAAIQDWVDADDDSHIGGAESDYYQGLNPPYMAKNGPIDDLSELLLIKGVTPEIYLGGSSTNYIPPASQGLKNPFGSGAPPSYAFGLKDVFTSISSGKININTAPTTILQLIPGIDPVVVPDIIKMRAGPDGVDGTEDDTPLHSVGELATVLGNLNRTAQGLLNRLCTVRSSTFEVEVDAEISGYRRKFFAIVGRNNQKDLQVLSFYWTTP